MPIERILEAHNELKDAFAYYSDDVRAIADALDLFRCENLRDHSCDGSLRVIILALEAVADSLMKKSENL